MGVTVKINLTRVYLRMCDNPRNRKVILQGLFIIVTIFILSAAFAVFKALLTTNKTSSPENSRDQNEECVIFGFFDWHDLWHFLSSFALLMGAFVIMFISSEAVQSPQANTQHNRIEPEREVSREAETPA